MREIGVVPDGAVLIHNGLVVESGPTRRIENLQQARTAREIDAAGKVVMPAFVDPNALLVSAPCSKGSGSSKISLSVLSRKRLEMGASAAASALARAGILSVGAHTGCATDLRETIKALLIHQGLQKRPLRIRSILSPRQSPAAGDLIERWIPAVRKRKLASILELTATRAGEIRQVAMAGASAGFSLRLRSDEELTDGGYELAVEGGAVAIVAPPPVRADFASRLAAIGCVYVLSASDVLKNDALHNAEDVAHSTRGIIDEGGAVALGSGYGQQGFASFNPQFLLHLGSTRFGMTEEEAICAATWNAACSLRMSHVTGSLEPGKSADVLVMDVSDYRELARRAGHNDVQLVIRAGQIIYKRAALMGLD